MANFAGELVRGDQQPGPGLITPAEMEHELVKRTLVTLGRRPTTAAVQAGQLLGVGRVANCDRDPPLLANSLS